MRILSKILKWIFGYTIPCIRVFLFNAAAIYFLLPKDLYFWDNSGAMRGIYYSGVAMRIGVAGIFALEMAVGVSAVLRLVKKHKAAEIVKKVTAAIGALAGMLIVSCIGINPFLDIILAPLIIFIIIAVICCFNVSLGGGGIPSAVFLALSCAIAEGVGIYLETNMSLKNPLTLFWLITVYSLFYVFIAAIRTKKKEKKLPDTEQAPEKTEEN